MSVTLVKFHTRINHENRSKEQNFLHQNNFDYLSILNKDIFSIIMTFLTDHPQQQVMFTSKTLFARVSCYIKETETSLITKEIAFAILLDQKFKTLSNNKEALIHEKQTTCYISVIFSQYLKDAQEKIANKAQLPPKEWKKISSNLREKIIDALADSNRTILDQLDVTEEELKPFPKDFKEIVDEGKRLVKGCVFLHPNSLTFEKSSLDSMNPGFGLDRILIDGKLPKDYGGCIPTVETWCISRECHHWESHPVQRFGIPTEHHFNAFAKRLPLILFKGKKEGDKVEFVFNEHKIKLICHQNGHRYSSRPFEEQLKVNVLIPWARSQQRVKDEIMAKKNQTNFSYWDQWFAKELQEIKDEFYPLDEWPSEERLQTKEHKTSCSIM